MAIDPGILRIRLSTVARKLAFRAYRWYQEELSGKLPAYDFEVITLVRRLPEDAVCIDVGVNEGQLFHSMVQHCRKGCIYGFEPIPRLYRYLVKRYHKPRVQLYPFALSDTGNEQTFYHFPKRTGISGLALRDDLAGSSTVETIQVPVRKLDDLLDLQRIDFVKIDVEGAEARVLQGARQHLLRCRPVVVFECQEACLSAFGTDAAHIFSFFEELGYGISTLKYYLSNHPPLSRSHLLELVAHRYEYQFVAWPAGN